MLADKPIFAGRHLTAELKAKLHSLTATAILGGSILFVAPISFIYFCFTPFPCNKTIYCRTINQSPSSEISFTNLS